MAEQSVAAPPVDPSVAAPRANLAVICAIFFCSGVPALIYQLVWQRSLFTIYGINVESVTVVVTAFMLGLGLGSFAGGRLSRLGLPLLGVFGAVEIGIGVFGFFSLGLFHAVGELTLQMSAPLTALFTFLLVLIPTLLMGATLPLLTAHLVKHSGNVGRSVGLLYFVNTLGSAFACFIVAAFLMRLLGQQGAVTLACGLNLAVGVGALIAQVRSPRAGVAPGGRLTQFNTRGFWFALLLSALCGYIALSYEILWYRVYSFASGGVAQAFALLLGCYLLGIALGALASRRFCREPAAGEQVASLSGFVLFANLASYLLVPAAALITSVLHWGASLPLVAVAAGLLGAIFPLICHIAIAPDARAGEGLSYLYLANIAGSALGSLITGFVLMDHWTLGGISLFLALLGIALSLVLLLAARGRTRQKKVLTTRAAAIALTAVVIVFVQPWLFDGVYERLYFKDDYAGQRFAHLAENKSGVVSVTQDGEIQGGGVYDGNFSTDLVDDRNLIVRAYALSLLHEAPRDVLMIGLSSGSWAQVIANNPQVENLTVVEINPAYLNVMKNYPGEAGVLDNPKMNVVIDDGRRWLARNPDRKFDFIVQNTSFNWRAHATDLLSKEYLDLVRGHLKPGGVSFYNTTGSAEAQRTGALEYPNALRFINFMAVSESPIAVDRRRWERVLREYRIEGRPVFDLADTKHQARLDEVLALTDSLSAGYGPAKKPGENMETREGILARTEGAPTITDDNMTTEWGFN
ncbi:fused MFS/spermidine synthase [Mycobacterium manitobense]|uniref:Fused MFS/spermidine synthase n=1 Tax=[Mycobacterium] manitobense TaxID=190147 RepID=A0A9X2YES6_9MYCO|nr:fused MFS/spermidine synthase [[Mycobacterium] manitobense]MCV7173333.1 fused MFS/spermidine synthase [[Mycobacterium] manitobense]